jgi:hypothetical protein
VGFFTFLGRFFLGGSFGWVFYCQPCLNHLLADEQELRVCQYPPRRHAHNVKRALGQLLRMQAEDLFLLDDSAECVALEMEVSGGGEAGKQAGERHPQVMRQQHDVPATGHETHRRLHVAAPGAGSRGGQKQVRRLQAAGLRIRIGYPDSIGSVDPDPEGQK